MSTRTVLRISVVLEWICLVAGLGLSFALENSLPVPLQAWQAQEAERELAGRDVFVLGAGLLLAPTALVASVGLLFLQRWAAWLYLAVLIVGYLVFPFMGPTVEHALADAVDEIGVLLSGVILGLAFFSDALRREPVSPTLATEGLVAQVDAVRATEDGART